MNGPGYYRVVRDRFPAAYLRELEAGVLASPYLDASALGTEFVATRGFSIVFRRSAMDEVAGRFPYLRQFLAAAVFPTSNAFYLNPLVLLDGSRVDAHADCRALEGGQGRIIPTLVSVLYVRCPEPSAGGALVFEPGTDREARLQPRPGELVHFRGNLVHAVTALAGAEPRVSIVCEQYNLDASALARFPELSLLTRATAS